MSKRTTLYAFASYMKNGANAGCRLSGSAAPSAKLVGVDINGRGLTGLQAGRHRAQVLIVASGLPPAHEPGRSSAHRKVLPVALAISCRCGQRRVAAPTVLHDRIVIVRPAVGHCRSGTLADRAIALKGTMHRRMGCRCPIAGTWRRHFCRCCIVQLVGSDAARRRPVGRSGPAQQNKPPYLSRERNEMQASKNWAMRHLGKLTLLFVGVLFPLIMLGAVAEDVAEKQPFAFDQPILMYMHSQSSPFLDRLMYAATETGSALGIVPVTLLVLGWFMWRGRRAEATFWLTAVGGAAAINFIAKQGFARVRPALWVSRIHETTYSFPSGHAMASMALVAAGCVLLWPTRWRWPALVAGVVFVALVGSSRVYFGVHYPSDILAGWAASLAWVLGLKLLFDVRTARNERARAKMAAAERADAAG